MLINIVPVMFRVRLVARGRHPVFRGNLLVRGVGWSGVLAHQVLDVLFHAPHVVAIVHLVVSSQRE
jgi:hypothetical protein